MVICKSRLRLYGSQQSNYFCIVSCDHWSFNRNFFFLKKHAQKLESECVNTVAEMMNTSINVINAEAQLARIPEGLNAEEGEGEGEIAEGQEA